MLLVNAALIASLVPLCFAVARRIFGAEVLHALVAATVAASIPAAWSAAGSAVAESLVLPMVPATLLALHEAFRGEHRARTLLFGPAVALLYAAHTRSSVVVAAAAILLVVAGLTRAMRRSIAVGNLIGLGVGLVGVALGNRFVGERWDHAEALQGTWSDVVELVTSRAGLRELALTAVGHAWYVVVGSLALGAVGVAASVALVMGRRDRDREPAAAERWTVAFLLVSAAAVLAASAAFFAQNQFRADHLVYGRHNDSFTPIWVTAGVVTLLRWTPLARRSLLWAGGALAILAGILVATRDATAFGGYHSPFGVPAIARFVGDDPAGTYGRATAAAALFLLVMAAVARRRASALVVVAAAMAWFAWAGAEPLRVNDDLARTAYSHLEVPATVRRLGVDAIDIDVTATRGSWPSLTYGYTMPDVAQRTWDRRLGDRPREDVIAARAADSILPAAGARIAFIDRSGILPYVGAPEGVALWARRSVADAWERRGWLLPAGWPAPLPEAARHATVSIAGLPRDRVVEVAPAGSFPLEVTVRHDGRGSPWPHDASVPGDERVRVVADITPLGDGPRGARSGGELPSWVLPGDEVVVDARVHAVDEQLGPLPAGRYRVVIGVGQDEPAWLATSPGTTFTMVVR
jgi:hypothetical protein